MSQFFLDFQETLRRGRTGKRKQTEILDSEGPLIWQGEGVAWMGDISGKGRLQCPMSVLAEITGPAGSLSHLGQTLFPSMWASLRAAQQPGGLGSQRFLLVTFDLGSHHPWEASGHAHPGTVSLV